MLKFNKSGYLQIDFAFGLVGFLIFFILIYGLFIDYKNDLIVENKLVELNSNAQNLCFEFINFEGSPKNWTNNLSDVNYIGLKQNDSWQLDMGKFVNLTNDNYFEILNKLQIKSNIGINIKGIDSETEYVHFGVFPDKISVIYGNYVCYSIVNSEIVRIFVEVWE